MSGWGWNQVVGAWVNSEINICLSGAVRQVMYGVFSKRKDLLYLCKCFSGLHSAVIQETRLM